MDDWENLVRDGYRRVTLSIVIIVTLRRLIIVSRDVPASFGPDRGHCLCPAPLVGGTLPSPGTFFVLAMSTYQTTHSSEYNSHPENCR